MKANDDKIYEESMDFESLNEGEEVILSDRDAVFCKDLKVVASDNPYVLGKLVGTFMEIENDNGNGRWYPLETIKSRVVELPYTKRMMENKSLLGEAHHPEDRSNIWMNESCISTTKLEISPDGKRLIGEADILDTPNGRILNTLARYGTNIGVSARANGKGTKRGGHLVITPDKYFFKTFDAVLNPGFESARPSKFEPDGSPMQVYEEQEVTDNLYEEIKSQIEQNKCDSKMLEYYINYSGNEKLKELQNLFEEAPTEGSHEDKGDQEMTEVETLQEQVNKLSEENESLKTYIHNLTADVDTLQEEKSDYSERLAFVSEEAQNNQESAAAQVDELLDILYQQKNEMFGLMEELKDLQFRYAGLSSKVLNLSEEQSEFIYQSSLLDAQIEKLEEELNQKSEELVQVEASKSEPIVEEKVEEEEVEEPKKPRERVIPRKVELFEHSTAVVNEEKETEPAVDDKRQVDLIKKLGGK